MSKTTTDGQSVTSNVLLGGTVLSARDCYVIGLFCDEVERIAERNMLKTGKLEGSHYAAMRKLRATLPTPNNTPQRMARPSAGATYAGGDGSGLLESKGE